MPAGQNSSGRPNPDAGPTCIAAALGCHLGERRLSSSSLPLGVDGVCCCSSPSSVPETSSALPLGGDTPVPPRSGRPDTPSSSMAQRRAAATCDGSAGPRPDGTVSKPLAVISPSSLDDEAAWAGGFRRFPFRISVGASLGFAFEPDSRRAAL